MLPADSLVGQGPHGPAALAAGGRDNGKPGPRKGAEDYYGAFVLDPDGNNIEACARGANSR